VLGREAPARVAGQEPAAAERLAWPAALAPVPMPVPVQVTGPALVGRLLVLARPLSH